MDEKERMKRWIEQTLADRERASLAELDRHKRRILEIAALSPSGEK